MNWSLFRLAPQGERPQPSRSIETSEGIGDRLRTAAFAEIQARDAFLWAARHFSKEVQPELVEAWIQLSQAEQRHLEWLLRRMEQLGIPVQDRTVSDQLWHSLISCPTAKEFAHYMASAEERGRKAGIRFHEALLKLDPITAEIFGKIAAEEVSHIELAQRFFPA